MRFIEPVHILLSRYAVVWILNGSRGKVLQLKITKNNLWELSSRKGRLNVKKKEMENFKFSFYTFSITFMLSYPVREFCLIFIFVPEQFLTFIFVKVVELNRSRDHSSDTHRRNGKIGECDETKNEMCERVQCRWTIIQNKRCWRYLKNSLPGLSHSRRHVVFKLSDYLATRRR